MRNRGIPRALIAALALAASAAYAQDRAIPPGNDPSLASPPPRPPLGDAADRAARLFDAIRSDQPATASDLFLPRDAFRLIKAIADPDPLWDRLYAAYERDIHALASTPDLDRAAFARLELSRRRGWVGVREEANRLPYWAQRHNRLVYRVGDDERSIEVRTMIAWGDRWYITHLSEFR